MISFDCFAFVSNEHRNRFSIYVVNRVRAHQFQMFQNFFEFIIQFVADFTRLISKRFFIDITNIVNQFVQKKSRDKFRKNVNKIIQTVVFFAFTVKKVFDRRSNQKNANRTFEVNSILVFYNSIFFEFVVVRFRQKIRQFARFASRVSSFFQFLFQEKNDDHDFDNFSFIRSYANFVDHELNRKFEHVSNHDDDEKKNSRLFNKKIKKHTRKRSSNNAFEFEKLISKIDVTTKI